MLTAAISPVFANSGNTTFSRYGETLDPRLIETGFRNNIQQFRGGRGLVASASNYNSTTWTRDLDYAARGYSHYLDEAEMVVFKENIQLFLSRVDSNGIVPETIHNDPRWIAYWSANCKLGDGTKDDIICNDYENRRSWDSMPNIIHATYAYVSKTGDLEFYNRNRGALIKVGEWIARLDTDGDELPDKDIMPFGYFDSTNNSPTGSYAVAQFYGAYNKLAEMERAVGQNGGKWSGRARKMKQSFMSSDRHWKAGQQWPIAWKKADGYEEDALQTFGVFEAIQSGLIAKEDGAKYDRLMKVMDDNYRTFLTDWAPMKLTMWGYDGASRRSEQTPDWMLNASAPWIVGLAVPTYLEHGTRIAAQEIIGKYETMVARTNPPVIEFVNGNNESKDRGRSWDTWAWFNAVYNGHYGFEMTPEKLIIHPKPIKTIRGDGVQNYHYQGAKVQLDVYPGNGLYRFQSDKKIKVAVHPIGTRNSFHINDGGEDDYAEFVVEPCKWYVVHSNLSQIDWRTFFDSGQTGTYLGTEGGCGDKPASPEPTAPLGPNEGDDDVDPDPTSPRGPDEGSETEDPIDEPDEIPPNSSDEYLFDLPTVGNSDVACVIDTDDDRTREVFYSYVTSVLGKAYTCQ